MRRSALTAKTLPLCPLADIPDGTARGFDLPGPDGPSEIFVVRRGATVTGSVNSCPHVGTPLNIAEDRFFTRDGRFLLYRTHGARFRPADGQCVSGPCVGARLTPCTVAVEEDTVVAAVPDGASA